MKFKLAALIAAAMLCSGCRSDAVQQDAIALARSKGADIRISVTGDAQRVDLRRCPLDDELKAALKSMPAIETLLTNKDFSDDDLDLLESRTSLRNLDLSRSKVTASTFRQLAQLRQLEFLSLNGTTLSDSDMELIAQLRQLTSLSLVDATVSEESLQQFRKSNPGCTVAR